MTPLDWSPYLHLSLALLLGTAIGLERLLRHNPAGLHTNALVALGSAGFVMAGTLTSGDSPTRIAAQVVSGIGFLCAGVILRHGMTVRGLNTAATVWCSSAVGVLAAVGLVPLAIAFALGVVLTNFVLHIIEARILKMPAYAAHKND
ncbi:MAG: mgtC [Nevskia sp.]|nr:mgtC [Nevskia sp.]